MSFEKEQRTGFKIIQLALNSSYYTHEKGDQTDCSFYFGR